jgi:hypothetical protein
LLALLLLLHTPNALADPDAFVATSPAARLFDEGRELKAAGKIDQACERFARSWQAEHAAGTEVNLADCKEREGKLLEAWQLFDDAARISEQQGNATRATFAKNRAAAIDARLMTVEVHIGAPVARDTVVTIDGEVSQRVRLDPRPVHILARAPDGLSYALVVPAQAGTVVVDVPSLVRTKTIRRRSRLWMAGGAVVLGATAFVVSMQLSMIAEDVRDSIVGCQLDMNGVGTCESRAALDAATTKLAVARADDVAATIVMGGGAVALIGAAVLWYTAPKERVLITPTATSSSVGVALAARF